MAIPGASEGSWARMRQRFLQASAELLIFWPVSAPAQELARRTYSAVPIDTNFIVVDHARSSGDLLFDPSLPVTDLQAKINTYAIGYSHSFSLLGHVASVALSAPCANANLTGNVGGVPGHAYRLGLGNMRFRFAANLLGDPLVTPEEFMQRSPQTSWARVSAW
jgi:hypothetical protein